MPCFCVFKCSNSAGLLRVLLPSSRTTFVKDNHLYDQPERSYFLFSATTVKPTNHPLASQQRRRPQWSQRAAKRRVNYPSSISSHWRAEAATDTAFRHRKPHSRSHQQTDP